MIGKVTTRLPVPGLRTKVALKRNLVLFLGDSLTAGFGNAPSEAFPALIQEHWKQNKFPWRAKNVGVSGDTTAGVLRRLDWVLTSDVHTVFLCIGANDGLRGLSLKAMQNNLKKIIQNIQKRGVRVILAGMMIPPNYGPKHTELFKQTYIQLGEAFKLKRMPFLLEGVAGKSDLNLRDGIHPNPKGHQIIARNVLAFFKTQNILQK